MIVIDTNLCIALLFCCLEFPQSFGSSERKYYIFETISMSQSAGIHADPKDEDLNMEMSFLLLGGNLLIPSDTQFFTVPRDSLLTEFQPIWLFMFFFCVCALLLSTFIEKIIKAAKSFNGNLT